jgi:hypothetical protein
VQVLDDPLQQRAMRAETPDPVERRKAPRGVLAPFEVAYEAIKAIWGLLPAAIGDLAFQAANSLVDGVEAMRNGVVSRINGFIGGINQGLEALGSERRISLVPDLDLGEIENRFEGAATAATTAAQAAFDRAFEDNPLTAPDLGLTEAANRALESANLYRGAARDLAEGARASLESWQALRDAVRGTDEASADALTEATGAAERLERPDRMVFDLDPDEGMGWADIRQVAFDIRDHLRGIGLESGALLTGGKGVHVWMPLRRISGWDTVKGFARTFAHALADREPRRFTATMSKSKRKGRIFVDWLRNERGATAIAPYSLRARPGAPVAVPVPWDELEDIEAPNVFRMGDMADRQKRDCPYTAQLEDLQSLGREAVDKLEDWIAEG